MFVSAFNIWTFETFFGKIRVILHCPSPHFVSVILQNALSTFIYIIEYKGSFHSFMYAFYSAGTTFVLVKCMIDSVLCAPHAM